MIQRRTTSKKMAAVAFSLTLVATAGACSDGGSAAEGETKLTYAGYLMEGNPHVEVSEWAMKEIESRSDGRITFEKFHGGTVCQGPEIVQCLGDGRADMSIITPAYHPDSFLGNKVAEMPFVGKSMASVSNALIETRKDHPEMNEEIEKLGVQHMTTWPAGEVILEADSKLDTVESLKGKSFRAVGPAFDAALKKAGASTNPISVTELYESLDRGVIDASAHLVDTTTTYNLDEVSKHIAYPKAGVYATMVLGMSKKAYDELAPDLQAVIDEVSGELESGKALEILSEQTIAQCTKLKDAGNIESFEAWDQGQTSSFQALGAKPAQDLWLGQAKKAGVDNAAEILESYLGHVEELDKDPTPGAVDECMKLWS